MACILEPDEDSKAYRKNWARLIQKIYEVDLLSCPKCQGQTRIISFIEDPEVIKKTLKHLGLWLFKHIAFFEKANPGHARGDKLVCFPRCHEEA